MRTMRFKYSILLLCTMICNVYACGERFWREMIAEQEFNKKMIEAMNQSKPSPLTVALLKQIEEEKQRGTYKPEPEDTHRVPSQR